WVKVLRVLAAQRALAGAAVDVTGHRQRRAAGVEDLAAAATSPKEPLGGGEGGAATGRAYPLVMTDVVARDLVPVAELFFDRDQVLHVHARGEGVAAAAAMGRFAGAADILVEA